MNGFQEYMTLSEWMEKVISEVDNTTPLELLEAWYDDAVNELPTGHAQCFEELLDIFKQRGVSFDD